MLVLAERRLKMAIPEKTQSTKEDALRIGKQREEETRKEKQRQKLEVQAEKLKKSEMDESASDMFAEMAKGVDVGEFMNAPVYTGGRDFLAGLSSGFGMSADRLKQEGSEILSANASQKKKALEVASDPKKTSMEVSKGGGMDLLGQLGDVHPMLGVMGKGLGMIGDVAGDILGGLKGGLSSLFGGGS